MTSDKYSSFYGIIGEFAIDICTTWLKNGYKIGWLSFGNDYFQDSSVNFDEGLKKVAG